MFLFWPDWRESVSSCSARHLASKSWTWQGNNSLLIRPLGDTKLMAGDSNSCGGCCCWSSVGESSLSVELLLLLPEPPLPLLPIENRFRTLSGLNGCDDILAGDDSSTPDDVGLLPPPPLLDRNFPRSDSPRLKVCLNRTATLSGGEEPATTSQPGSLDGEVGGDVIFPPVAAIGTSSTGERFFPEMNQKPTKYKKKKTTTTTSPPIIYRRPPSQTEQKNFKFVLTFKRKKVKQKTVISYFVCVCFNFVFFLVRSRLVWNKITSATLRARVKRKNL